MLSRRHLRIRVMQALYTWYQSEDKNIGTSVNEIFRGTERTYDLYLSLLQILPELAEEERKYYADLQPRFIPKDEPVLSSMANNHFVIWLSTFSDFNDALKKRKISWQKDAELVLKFFISLETLQNTRSTFPLLPTLLKKMWNSAPGYTSTLWLLPKHCKM
jgi:N utilization substance protein B